MSDPLTPDDLERMRHTLEEWQRDLRENPPAPFDSDVVAKIVADAVRLLDEVERLRRPQSERDQMARLQTEWEQHVIAGFERAMDIRDNPKPYAVQQSTTTRVIPQSEAPSVSEGGRD